MLSVKKPWVQSIILVALSWMVTVAGILIGDMWIRPGDGFPQGPDVTAELFRFDSVYYKSIAENFYQYSGDPFSSPNIVFAPLYPLLIKVISTVTSLDVVSAGFLINGILFFLAVHCLLLFLTSELGPTAAFFSILAMASAAGSYSFHAYYSESTMLFCLCLAFLAYQRRWILTSCLAVGLLGASRLAALPMVVAWGFLLWRLSAKKPIWQRLTGLLIAFSGIAAYLGYLAWNFGEPFGLLNSIQKSSWGRFHSPVDWSLFLSGGYVLNYALDAADKGWATFSDIQTLNLLWLVLAAAACVHLLRKNPKGVLAATYIPYFLFVYYSNVTSPYLISAHRLFVIMPPIFIMFSDVVSSVNHRGHHHFARLLAIALLLINMAYGFLHTAMFNQGIWFWF